MSLPEPESVSAIVGRLVSADGAAWSLLTGHHDLDQVAERLRRISRLPKLPDVRHLHLPADRLPLVVAHGPGFTEAIAQIVANRGRVLLIAPFRSAVRLIEAGVVPDVIVLADRDTWPVAATLEQWRALPPDQSRRLSAATLIVDAFVPAEIVQRFTRACTFDSGLGCGTALPFHGFGVLVAVSLALMLGHRLVAIAGVDLEPASRLGALLKTLGEASHVRLAAVSGGLASALESGPQAGPREERLQTALTPSHFACARRVAATELDALAGLCSQVEQAARWSPDDPRVIGLVENIWGEWRVNATVAAAVQRADLRWLTEMWELAARSIAPIDARRATRMTARLILPELVAALGAHLRDCRSCLDRNLSARDEAVA